VDPRRVRITVERQLTREVKVQPRFEGEPPEGYEVYQWSIIPATVSLRGAASNVEAVTEVSTETVSLAGRQESFRDEVAIDIGDTNVSIGDDRRSVTLVVIIGEERIERTFPRVPLIVSGGDGAPTPLNRFLTVTLFGARSAINELSASDISAVVQVQSGADIPREVTPTVTVSRHSDRVAVSSFEPNVVRLR
jgi:YbbR domain-containing protein